MNYKNLLYFDIETVSRYKNIEELKNNDERGYYLFMRKIERKSNRFEDWKEDADTVYKDKASLIPEYGKIVCISMAYYNGNDELKTKSIYGDDEEKLIKDFHKIITAMSNNTTMGLCGYYIKGFDIPWLNKKMMRYGLEIPTLLKTFNVKPWEMNVFDLAEIWRSNGTLENSSFDEMLCEIGVKSPKNDISGEDVSRVYWEENDLERIKDYCEEDVRASVEAAEKLSLVI